MFDKSIYYETTPNSNLDYNRYNNLRLKKMKCLWVISINVIIIIK